MGTSKWIVFVTIDRIGRPAEHVEVPVKAPSMSIAIYEAEKTARDALARIDVGGYAITGAVTESTYERIREKERRYHEATPANVAC